MYLLNAIGIMPPEKPGKFITRLGEASIPTRYPEDLAKVQQVYTEGVVKDILAGGKEAIAWILCGTHDRPHFTEDRTVRGESPRRGGGPPLSVGYPRRRRGCAGRAEKLPHALQLRGPSPRTKRRERTSGQSFAPLSKSAVVAIVARLRRGIEARGIRPQTVILYGSYADATHREGSDIDVVIISDDFAGKGYWERIDILADAIYEIFAPIEAVTMTPEEWERGDSLIAAFVRKGEVLYAG